MPNEEWYHVMRYWLSVNHRIERAIHFFPYRAVFLFLFCLLVFLIYTRKIFCRTGVFLVFLCFSLFSLAFPYFSVSNDHHVTNHRAGHPFFSYRAAICRELRILRKNGTAPGCIELITHQFVQRGEINLALMLLLTLPST